MKQARPGRPTQFNEDVAALLIALVSEGLTRKAAAARADIAERTLHDWLIMGRRGDPRFAALATTMDAATNGLRDMRRERQLGRIRVSPGGGRGWKKIWMRGLDRRLGPCEFYRRRLGGLGAKGQVDGVRRLG